VPPAAPATAQALTGLETGAIAGVEHGFASIGNEHDRVPDDIDELVFASVPMALTGPSAWAQHFTTVEKNTCLISPPENGKAVIIFCFICSPSTQLALAQM
jgi:hypothetical protein